MDRIERTLQVGHPDEPRYTPRPAGDIIGGPRARPGGPSGRDTPRQTSMVLAAGLVALVLVLGAAWLLTLRPSSTAVGAPEPSLTASPSPRSPRECGPDDLTATFLHAWQSAGRLSAWVRFEMQGPTPCTVYGEPRVSIRSGDGRPVLESRLAGSLNADGAEARWHFRPGAMAGGWVAGANWCEDAGPPPYQLIIDEGPWQSAVLELDQLPPCIDASEAAWIQDVQTAAEMEVPLETVEAMEPSCRGVGLEGTLAGDAADPRLVWLQRTDGSRSDLVWPAYYRAVFGGDGLTDLAIIDARKTIVIRAGDRITGACVTSDPAVLLLAPPFR